jgi:hypothetical protein
MAPQAAGRVAGARKPYFLCVTRLRRGLSHFRRGLLVALATSVATPMLAHNDDESPVARVAKGVYVLKVGQQSLKLPIEMSASLASPHPLVTRAVVVLHGKGRNVEGYYRALLEAAKESRQNPEQTVLVAPQFLRQEDIQAHQLGADFLRWHLGSWSAGYEATAPMPVSSFDVIDAILGNLSDRTLFPNLSTIVLVGHSGGGQLLNRYAVVSARAQSLSSAGIHVRYVIANPSSFLYFSDERLTGGGLFASFHGTDCQDFNHWRYGTEKPPPYVSDSRTETWQSREVAYAKADVIYLLGSEDVDPEQRDLDTSCAAEAQGATRLDRGFAYYRYLRLRHPQAFGQRLWVVKAVAHNGERMIDSSCGRSAIFDAGGCATDQSNTQ